MKVNDNITIDFTEKEIIEILKQHMIREGYTYNSHRNILKDVAIDDDRGPYHPEYILTGMSFSVKKEQTVNVRDINVEYGNKVRKGGVRFAS